MSLKTDRMWGVDRVRDRPSRQCETQHLRPHGSIRNGTVSFPDRARWLQGIRRSGEMGKFYAEMVHSILRNIEETFAGIDTDLLQKAAEAIWAARLLYQLRYQPMTQCRKHTSPHHKCKFGQNKSCRFNDMIYNTIAMVSMIAPMVPNGL